MSGVGRARDGQRWTMERGPGRAKEDGGQEARGGHEERMNKWTMAQRHNGWVAAQEGPRQRVRAGRRR
jgi:hypothetical protein